MKAATRDALTHAADQVPDRRTALKAAGAAVAGALDFIKD